MQVGLGVAWAAVLTWGMQTGACEARRCEVRRCEARRCEVRCCEARCPRGRCAVGCAAVRAQSPTAGTTALVLRSPAGVAQAPFAMVADRAGGHTRLHATAHRGRQAQSHCGRRFPCKHCGLHLTEPSRLPVRSCCVRPPPCTPALVLLSRCTPGFAKPLPAIAAYGAGHHERLHATTCRDRQAQPDYGRHGRLLEVVAALARRPLPRRSLAAPPPERRGARARRHSRAAPTAPAAAGSAAASTAASAAASAATGAASSATAGARVRPLPIEWRLTARLAHPLEEAAQMTPQSHLGAGGHSVEALLLAANVRQLKRLGRHRCLALVPAVRMQGTRNAQTCTYMHIQCTHAVHMRCTCGAHAVHMRCTCGAHAVHMRCTCSAHAVGIALVPAVLSDDPCALVRVLLPAFLREQVRLSVGASHAHAPPHNARRSMPAVLALLIESATGRVTGRVTGSVATLPLPQAPSPPRACVLAETPPPPPLEQAGSLPS
eukprot:scaffold106404_cov64-Phaeocystis_antarctica.AAC.4